MSIVYRFYYLAPEGEKELDGEKWFGSLAEGMNFARSMCYWSGLGVEVLDSAAGRVVGTVHYS